MSFAIISRFDQIMRPHIYFITRFFSGLFETIKTSDWQPTGVPAVVKLVEKVSGRAKTTWILVCKNKEESDVIRHKYTQLVINNIHFHILPYIQVLNSYRLSLLATDIIAFFFCVRLTFSTRNKLFYTDVANITIAAALKMLLKTPVMVRVLGVKPYHKAVVSSLKTRLMNPLQYLAYKIKYDLVICSQDGSGVEYYLGKLLNRKTPIKILLNGIQKSVPSKSVSQRDKLTFLFVGKLIDDKGILELIEAIADLRKTHFNFRLKVVGKGDKIDQVKCMLKKRNLVDHVDLIGSVTHSKIYKCYHDTDVYISLNKNGNLSNTVLEAMAAGKCTITLGKDAKTYTDVFTEKHVPEDAVIRIDRGNIVMSLSNKLTDLIDNREKIDRYANRMKAFADKFLWSWEERIKYEIDLMMKLIQHEPIMI